MIISDERWTMCIESMFLPSLISTIVRSMSSSVRHLLVCWKLYWPLRHGVGGGGGTGSSVGRALDSCWGGPGVRFLLWPPAPYWLGQYNVIGWDRSHGLPALFRAWQHVKFSDVCHLTRPRYSLVVDEVVKKQTKQKTKSVMKFSFFTSKLDSVRRQRW